MNKNLKYGIYFTLAALGTYGLIRILKRKNQAPEGVDVNIDPGSGSGLTIDKLSKTLNRNKTLSQGSTGPEVRELQRLVGADADGVFGPMTLAALQRAAGVSSTTLAKLPAQIAAVTARNNANAADAAMKSKFPKGKSVVAAIPFRGYAYMFRNNSWYNTNSDGLILGSQEFRETADLGSVHDYSNGLVIIKLRQPINGYDYMGVKSTWIK